MFHRRRRSRLAEVTRTTVALQLKTGRTVVGLLLAEYDDVVAITRARVENDAGELVEADGEVLIPIGNIEICQVGVQLPPAGEAEQLTTKPTTTTPVRVLRTVRE